MALALGAIAASASFGAGYAFRESLYLHKDDKPMHLIVAGQGAFLGAIVGCVTLGLAVLAGHVL